MKNARISIASSVFTVLGINRLLKSTCYDVILVSLLKSDSGAKGVWKCSPRSKNLKGILTLLTLAKFVKLELTFTIFCFGVSGV